MNLKIILVEVIAATLIAILTEAAKGGCNE